MRRGSDVGHTARSRSAGARKHGARSSPVRSVECRENPCYLSYRANGTDHCQKHDESKWASRTSSDAAERRVRPVQGDASPGAELRPSETRLVPKIPTPSTTAPLLFALVDVRASRAGTADALRRDAITLITRLTAGKRHIEDRKIHWIAGTATVAMCDERMRADAPAFRDIILKL